MSNGFKFKRINMVCGSTEYPYGDNDTSRDLRSNTTVKNIAQALIDSGNGWVLDTTRNPEIINYADVPCKGSNTSPALFLRNTISGCKLFIVYNGYKYDKSLYFARDDIAYNYNNSSNGQIASGLAISIIAENSLSEFGDTFDSTFLPNDATRIACTSPYYVATNSYYSAFAINPNSGSIISYGVYSTPYCICISCGYSTTSSPANLGSPMFACGRILGSLAHDVDTLNTAKYGVIYFRLGTASGVSEGTGGLITRNVSISGTDKLFYGISFNDSFNSLKPMGQIFSSTGTVLNGSYNSRTPRVVADTNPFSSYVFNTVINSKTRWTPFAVAMCSGDTDTYGIIQGDGFKGYLDTDLFRCGLGTYCQTFDNGNFICPNDNFGLILGWDPTNTDSLAG